MTANPVQQLATYGPEHCETMTVEQARAFCRRLADGRYENFSVLSRLVPRTLRDDFASVYAFCRWADDLGDEIGDADRSLELLAWWRRELERCFDGRPRHPVFVALAPVIARHDLPQSLFDDLISAFEQDQRVRRYETWRQLLDYCSLSANPVGRLVLIMLGEKRQEDVFALGDAICTALQLTNHWQDIRRDMVERDRVYVPSELNPVDRFEERLIASARQGYAVDRTFLPQSRQVVRMLVQRTWQLYERGAGLLDLVSPPSRPLVWLFAAGGQHVLRSIEMWNCETVLHRPKLSRFRKLTLVLQAGLGARLGLFNRNRAR
ncbi:MAG: squalene synthase HpnC [Phycisphaerales bacterium]|nr:MAG: squalene synthase HpnC [Phycisphaerales bacterium]